MITVTRLFIYPIKSCAPVEVSELTFDEYGPVGDRRFMLIDGEGNFLSQRKTPAMAHIRAHFQGADLLVSADGEQDLLVAAGSPLAPVVASVWDDEVHSGDCGDVAAAWFSRVLNTPCRLVRILADSRRQVSREYADDGEWVGFADGFPLLICSQASLDALARHAGRPLEAERFRPNVMVDGTEPFAELGWRELQAGDGRLLTCKPCERCVIPTRNPATLAREADVIDALKTFCRIDGRIIFGMNALVRNVKTVKSGDCWQLVSE
ncbi:MAG: MOSC N-terminal beta barrel domain-containing protein [Pseudomonadota bacterium]|nr:MOSC N-terminal beta barrel domain-containing protein [Pseudomonadota bacterium]